MQPDNLEILVNHLKCAAFELPLSPEDKFGGVDLPTLCERLGEAGYLHRSGGNWHWVQQAYPADTVSLRAVTSDNFVIIDTTGGEDGDPEVIGEVDFSSALTTVHPKAIYIHQGQQYHVEKLDFDQRKAYVKPRQRGLLHRRDPLHAGARARNCRGGKHRRTGGARARRCAGAVAGGRIQEDQIFHQ